MKVLRSFTFENNSSHIQYQEAWFCGKPVQLDAADLGPGDLHKKLVCLRKHAASQYGLKLQAQIDEDAQVLTLKSYAPVESSIRKTAKTKKVKKA